jgi:glycosyltransferase involved in cell wall biosynthesis
MKINKFKIITPSYNNAEWIEYNIASILNQTYTNYEVLYIDDASTDDTYDKVFDIVGKLPNWKVVRNPINIGATRNYFENLNTFVDGDDIVIHLDGDDWFYDEFVLENINKFYNEKDCWMSYGGFVCWDGTENPIAPYPQNTHYPDFVHEHKKYRQDVWRASHLRTYRAFLLKSLPLDAIRDLETGEYYWHASDLAFQFPLMEMCSKDRIGVFDFHTCVYNQSKSNSLRTRERESVDNTRYEIEIRNRKRYKEGLSGERLPQVNNISSLRENNNIPKDFTYVYNQTDGEFDLTMVVDMDIIKYITGVIKINRGKVVADIHEPPYLFDQQQVYDLVYENYHMFDRILTYDEKLLTLPNAMFRNGGYECVLNKSVHTCEYPTLMDTSLFQVYPKNKKLSFITSNKTFTDGHKFRVSCVEALRTSQLPVDVYGVGYRTIPAKLEGLKDYQYSIAIENGIHQNYFTEKILDCFLTGTIPIYRGCPNIGNFFNMDGIITFNTQEELLDIVAYLQNNDYIVDSSIIQDNFNRALSYQYDNDALYKKFIQNLIN